MASETFGIGPGDAVNGFGETFLAGQDRPDPRPVAAAHGLDTMPPYLREGAVVSMGPVTRWVGERPTDPLTVVVAPLEDAGRTELAVPVDGREVGT